MVDSKYLKLLGDYDLHCQHIVKSTIVNTGESSPDKLQRVAFLEKDYIAWFEYYFPHYAKKKSAKYHKRLSDKIIKNKRIRLLAEIFRSGAKSVHIDMGIPLYLYLAMGEMKFMLLVAETDPKGKKLLSGIQSELEFNQRLLNDYGRKMKKGDWADGDFYTVDGVRFMSIGFGMSPRGLREGAYRPDYIPIDDVDSKKHVNNNEIMGASVDYISEEIEGCFDTDSGDDAIERMIYSNNNFHKNSITNRLKNQYLVNIKKDEEAGEKSDYVVFTVTAVKDLVNFESNWPEKTSNDYWRKKYNRNPRSFMREYMHMHVSEGKIFKGEHMQWGPMMALKKYDALCIYGDLSYKDQADYKSMIFMGKSGREMHVLHVLCRQASRTMVAQWLYDLWEDKKLKELNVPVKIEGLFAMDEFVSEFDNEGDIRGYYIPVIPDKKPKANKYDRVESISGSFERRWVFFNEKEKNNSDQVTLVDQLLGFEKGSSVNDDGPDAMHGCMNELNNMTFVEKFTPRITKRLIKKAYY